MNRLVGWFPAIVAIVACGSSGRSNEADMGSVALAIETHGVRLDSVTFTITGDDYSRTTVVNVANSTRISSLFSAIPAGHFQIALSATDASDPSIECTGEGVFEIVARQTTSSSVDLYCRRKGTTGSVAIEGSVHRCPVIDALSAEPSEAVVGEVISLSAHADDSTSDLVYEWTASDGTLANADSSEAKLTCTSAGPVSVELRVLGAEGACLDTAAADVYCTAVAPPTEVTDDPATPGDDRPGYTACEPETCGPGLVCCARGKGCATSRDACSSEDDTDYTGYLTCDGPEDCPPSEQCAVSKYWVSCGPATFYGVRCHRDSDCVSTPESPNPCRPSGYCDGPFE